MKKAMIILACLMICGMLSVKAAEQWQIALQHNGNVTHFDCDQLSKAIAAAENGDTIFLSEGTFSSSSTSITINKAITIIGAGADNTKISPSVYVNIPNSPTLTARLLDGVSLDHLTISCEVTGLSIRKCKIQTSLSFITNDNKIKEVVIDRCSIGTLYLSSAVGSLVANNSSLDLKYQGYRVPSAVFVNCDVHCYTYANEKIGAHFLNCRIDWDGISNVNYDENIRFTNCLAKEGFPCFNAKTATNCYTYSGDLTDTSNEYFVSQGWVGTDGTAVGMYGTTTPYTLTPSGLTVTSYKLGVDTEKKKLNVKMTLGSH